MGWAIEPKGIILVIGDHTPRLSKGIYLLGTEDKIRSQASVIQQISGSFFLVPPLTVGLARETYSGRALSPAVWIWTEYWKITRKALLHRHSDSYNINRVASPAI